MAAAELDRLGMHPALEVLANDIRQLKTRASVLVERPTVKVSALLADHALEPMSVLARDFELSRADEEHDLHAYDVPLTNGRKRVESFCMRVDAPPFMVVWSCRISPAASLGGGVMRRFVICVFVGVCVALLSIPVAGAEKPAREFVPASDFVIEDSCAFDVGAEILQNGEYGITFSGGALGGATLVTGPLKIQLTNLADTSKSITVNIPGPGLNSFSEDGFRLDARGPWIIFYPGTLVYTTGYVTFTITAAGFSLEQRGGTQTDLCAVLA